MCVASCIRFAHGAVCVYGCGGVGDSGLLAMATGHYADAVLRFEECFATDPTNIVV